MHSKAPPRTTCACTASRSAAKSPPCSRGSTSTRRAFAAEIVALEEAVGRTLAADVIAPLNVPGFDRAAMDGYALRGAATAGAGEYNPLSFPVHGQAMPGQPFNGASRAERPSAS